uniref:Uncharacterized protein n=1 Tax=Parascaris equorum TaxID=6256 RepID=A0A914SF90_PAREQ
MNISVLVKDGKRCEDSIGSPDSNSEQLLNLSGLPDGLPDIKSHQFYQQVRFFVVTSMTNHLRGVVAFAGDVSTEFDVSARWLSVRSFRCTALSYCSKPLLLLLWQMKRYLDAEIVVRSHGLAKSDKGLDRSAGNDRRWLHNLCVLASENTYAFSQLCSQQFSKIDPAFKMIERKSVVSAAARYCPFFGCASFLMRPTPFYIHSKMKVRCQLEMIK